MTFPCGQYSSAFGGRMDFGGKPNVSACENRLLQYEAPGHRAGQDRCILAAVD